MYYIKIGTLNLRGYATAAAAWSDRALEVRRNSMGLEEFKERLDTGQILIFHAAYVFLDGEAAKEDLSAYDESDYYYTGPDVVIPIAEVKGAAKIEWANSDDFTWHGALPFVYGIRKEPGKAVRNNNSKEH